MFLIVDDFLHYLPLQFVCDFFAIVLCRLSNESILFESP